MSDFRDTFLPYARQDIDDDDVAAVSSVLRGNWLTTGPAVEAFEAAFAERVTASHAVCCSSGTAALHLAALALGLGEDDTVIVPSVTFLATANAARYVGAEVIFADVDADTGLMSAADLDDAVSKASKDGRQVRAVFPVHLNGQCVNMDEIQELAEKYGLHVVEDASHALGGDHGRGDKSIPVGSCRGADMAIFSLHAIKTITMGEGGIITTNKAEIQQRLARFRNHGIVRDADAFESQELARNEAGGTNQWYYEMPEPGFNYRASDIHCALGHSQLGKLERFVAVRDRLVARYDRQLAALAPLVRPVGRVPWCRPSWHLYVILVDFDAIETDRSEFIEQLRERGIGSQVHYLPVHMQPYYRKRYGAVSLPGAERYYRRCLSLPLFAGMDDSDVDYVAEAVAALCAQ